MERGIVPLSLIVVLGGCAAENGDEAMFVLKNVRADSTCMVTSPSETEAGISQGTLDVRTPSGYVFIAQTKSRVTALTGQEDQRTIILTDAKVDLTFPGSTLFTAADLADLKARGVTHFKQLFTAPLAPNGGLVDVGFVLLPPAVVTELSADMAKAKLATLQVVATFTIEGDMSGGIVSSQAFTYPVTMGNGLTANVLGACPLPTGTVLRTGYACNPAQDGVVDCCASGAALTCPATVATM
jgi:hypothetical protein